MCGDRQPVSNGTRRHDVSGAIRCDGRKGLTECEGEREVRGKGRQVKTEKV